MYKSLITTQLQPASSDDKANSNSYTERGKSWIEECVIIPKSITDCKVLASFILEVCVLTGYSVHTYFENSPKWIAYVIAFWLLIVFMSLGGAIRFVHTFYEVYLSLLYFLLGRLP